MAWKIAKKASDEGIRTAIAAFIPTHTYSYNTKTIR